MHEALTETFDSLLTRLCSDLVRDTRNAKAGITIPINNLWGDFVIQTEFDEAGAVAIRFLQHRPLAAHLASELVKLNLPPRRLTVCWLALLGAPRKEIARLAEMSVDTVGEHLNALFAQFGVSSTQELAARFLA
jgi:DNA-binding NarL/FixJ family response regulator